VEENGDGRSRRFSKWITSARRYQQRVERRRWVAFPVESVRRFNRIEGKHLALVITVNIFVAIIPLIIVGYALLEGFNPHRSFGGVIVESFHLTGGTAQIVQNTFATAKSGQSVALSISVISLLITGLDVSATTQVAYARAFTMTPLRGVQKYVRGGAWLVLLLVSTGVTLTLRYLAAGRPLWFLLACCGRWSSDSSWLPPGCCLICPSGGVIWYPARPSAPAPPSSYTPWRCSSCIDGSVRTGTPTAASASGWR
jgi:uncharacterized BrkB/YihY/UPF0761 family membrane protein